MDDNVLNSALLEVSRALKPVSEVDTAAEATALMKNLGYSLPGQDFTGIPVSLIGKVGTLATGIELLVDADSDEDKLQAVLQLAAQIKDIAVDIADIAQKMQSAGAATAAFFSQAPVDELPGRLLDYVVSLYTQTYHGTAYAIFLLVGVFDETDMPANAAIFQPAFTLRKVWWKRLPRYVTEPAQLAEEIYHWQSGFDSDLFLTRLEKLLRAFVLPGGIYTQSNATRAALGNNDPATKEIRIPLFQAGDSPQMYSQFGLSVSGADAAPGKSKGLALVPYATGVASMPFNLNEDYDIVLEVSAGIDNGVAIVLRPPLSLEFINNLFTAPGSVGEFSIRLSVKRKADRAQEIFLFGSASTSHLSIKGFECSLFFSKKQSDLDYGFELEIGEGKVVIGVEGADGFIEKILSGIHMEMSFSLGVGFTAKGGLYFRGSGGLEVQIPLHLTLGPLQINSLLLKLQPDGGDFPLIAATSFGLSLGPLKAVVENIGIKLLLRFPDGGGNLGPADFSLGFQPPNGVGLSIDAGVVKGGGYLFFDFDKEEYAGALELNIAGLVDAKAVGLITTKMPDGSKGFSLLIIITAEFNPPFQLGFGFTLIGVGGLLGLNRTVLLQPLRDGVRTGAVNSIMFPKDVVENAPRIISDLRAIFPPYEGKFLIGPLAKLGWGTPSLISLSLGLIVEIPGNLAIIGVLRICLPDEHVPLINIQVNFVATVDFDKKLFAMDASLFDSHLLCITLEGDMAVRLSWGDSPDFLITVGGFHPSYTPPPLALPTLKRLSMSLLSSPTAKIRVEAYFAVTSNTVQVGAQAELFFGFSDFCVRGYLGFDALLRFSPFYFIIEIRAGVQLEVFGFDMLSIRLKFSLEGPSPWKAKGTGSISILFWDLDVDFSITWGDEANTTLPPIEIMPKWVEEIKKPAQWQAILPPESHRLVTLRKLEEDAEKLVLHPSGSFTVAQKLLPLDLTLDKVGAQVPSDVNKISITSAHSGGQNFTLTTFEDSFAPAQFKKMDDATKLSSASFQKMPAGVSISVGTAMQAGNMVKRKIEYELTIIDKEPRKPLAFGLFYIPVRAFMQVFFKNGAVAKSSLSKRHKKRLIPFDDKIKTEEEGFTVAQHKDNKLYKESPVFHSQVMAEEYLSDLIRDDAGLTDSLHVIPHYELNAS